MGTSQIGMSSEDTTDETRAHALFAPWPSFQEEEIQAAAAVLQSGKVNYWTGEEGRRFEAEFAAYAGCRYGVAVANGTVALELALRALSIGPGDEVIVPCRTFFASASCIVAVGARPVFADVDRDTQTITAATIGAVVTAATRAIIAVHLAGHPCEMDEINVLAKASGLFVVEDCAQAHGALYKGRPVGSLGDVAAFSFCQDKILTTAGEGGMTTTNREDLWKRMWGYKDHGKDYDAVYHQPHPWGFQWLHSSFGTNWRLSEVQSAVGRAALRKLTAWVETRRRNAAVLIERLRQIQGLRIPIPAAHIAHSYYKFYGFVCPEALSAGWNRDRIAMEIHKQGVPCSSGICSEVYLEQAFPEEWRPPSRLPVARELGETGLMFQVHPTLSQAAILYTCRVVESVLREATRNGQQQLQMAVRSEAADVCTQAGLPLGGVPNLLDSRAALSELRGTKFDDLLSHDRVCIDSESVRTSLMGRVVMVTGAAGSIGSELCKQIVRYQPAKLICVDQAETPLFNLQQHTLGGSSVEVVYSNADYTNCKRMRRLMTEYEVRVIFHAAAYKHVPMTELNPYEGLQNNVFGLLDLMVAAEECGCEDFLFLSTDKAVNPSSLMGCTKRLGEMIAGARESSRMRSVSVRFGNVLGSQGSVVPLFLEQIRTRKCVTVTHPEMTRYFMTIPEAVSLVLEAFTMGEHGDILVLDMGEPIRIVDLAKALIRLSGKEQSDVEIVYTGMRLGEKLHEELFYDSEERLHTSHAKVTRARGRMPRWLALSNSLWELRQIHVTQDGDLIRARVKQIIPEYQWDEAQSTTAAAVDEISAVRIRA